MDLPALAVSAGIPAAIVLSVAFLVVAIAFVIKAWVSVVNVQQDIATMREKYGIRIENLEGISHNHATDVDQRMNDFEYQVAKEIGRLDSNDRSHDQHLTAILQRITAVEKSVGKSVSDLTEELDKKYEHIINLLVKLKGL